MPAQNKQDLLAVTQAEYDRLDRLIADLDGGFALQKDADGVSVKDVIAHRAHWIDLFLGWYRDGRAGRPVAFPAPGYKWNELPRYNADLRARQAGLDWGDARNLLADRHHALTALLAGLDDAALYGGPMQGARNDWTTGRWAEAAGPSHYRSAAKYIRARVRAGA